MTDAEYAHKIYQVDRLLNDPEVPMEPAKVWALVDEIAQGDGGHDRNGLDQELSIRHGDWLPGR